MQRYTNGARYMSATLLFTTTPGIDLESQITRVRKLRPLPPFDAAATAFVHEFAQRIVKLPELRRFPELATLAHWFRPAAIHHLSHLTQGTSESTALALARGLVFHMAPANVDVLFAYAWLMSVLCGNANVARLSQKPSAQRAAMTALLAAMRDEGNHAGVLDRQLLLTYPHDDAVTALISRQCHARIVWGGDQTVARIRAIPLAPLAAELVFPDRFGVGAFDAVSMVRLEDNEVRELARRFCNDTLWFGQQACSSPRTLYWVGDAATVDQAKARFWPAVYQVADKLDDEPAALMARLTDAHLLAARDGALHSVGALDAYPLRLEAHQATDAMRESQSGHGLVVEVSLGQLTELATQLDDRDQTLVQFGFDTTQLRELLRALGSRAIDRVVPVGRALDFHHIWDGTDLLGTLTRRITLPAR